MLLGSLEAGGTKMVCALGNEKGEIFEREVFSTRMPKETLKDICDYFRNKGIQALGIASFGPLQLNPMEENFGSITTTPKLGWKFFPLLAELRQALQVPCGIDTDVNAAAYAEYLLGAAKGLKSCLYVTVGTGIGGGLILEGNLVHGLVHPEFGHMLLHPLANDPLPEGVCPYHTGCLEGLCSGPSLQKRYNVPAQELPPSHPAWDLECAYLGQMCANALMLLSVEKIILGGGVMQQMHLFEGIRKATQSLLGGYIQHPQISQGLSSLIVPPALGVHSGAIGGLLLAKKALEES